MKRFFDQCGEYRENLRLLAGGALSDAERAQVESHLIVCIDCRKYHDEMKSISGLLAGWEKNFAGLEPGSAAQARWAKDLSATAKPGPPAWIALLYWFVDWSKDMIWPCRRLWAGLAAIWVAIAVVNVSQRDPARTMANKSLGPSPELVRAFLRQEGFVGDSVAAGSKPAAESIKPPVPQPRSERRRNILRT